MLDIMHWKPRLRLGKIKQIYYFALNKKKDSLASVHLNVHIIAPINDSPLILVLYPSDNTL